MDTCRGLASSVLTFADSSQTLHSCLNRACMPTGCGHPKSTSASEEKKSVSQLVFVCVPLNKFATKLGHLLWLI